MEDMVLLVKIQEAAIVENLKKRYLDDLIYVSSFDSLLLLCARNPRKWLRKHYKRFLQDAS